MESTLFKNKWGTEFRSVKHDALHCIRIESETTGK